MSMEGLLLFHIPPAICMRNPSGTEPVLQSSKAENLQQNINRWVILINLDTSHPCKGSATRKKWGEWVPFMASERRNSHVAPPPSTASLPAFLSAQSWVPSLVVSNRIPTSTRLAERITKGFGHWEFQGWGWIPSLAEVTPFPFSPLPSALDSFPWGSEDASTSAGSCPYRAATPRHSYSLLGAPAEVLGLEFLAWLRSHVYPWVSHCEKDHQML